jgi:hypothetical protein
MPVEAVLPKLAPKVDGSGAAPSHEKPGRLALLLPKAEPVDAAGKEKPGRLALLLPKAEPVEKENPGRLALLLPNKAEPVDAAGETNDDPELAMLPRPKFVPTLVARPKMKAGADEAGDKLCAPKGKENPGRLALLLPNKAEPVDAAGETNDDPELAMLPRPKLVGALVARPKS